MTCVECYGHGFSVLNSDTTSRKNSAGNMNSVAASSNCYAGFRSTNMSIGALQMARKVCRGHV